MLVFLCRFLSKDRWTQQWWDDLLRLTCAKALHMAEKLYGSTWVWFFFVFFDIIIAHWLLAEVCVQVSLCLFFFSSMWEHSAEWQILQVTRHTSTWWQPIRYMHFTECKKRARVVRRIRFGSSFKEKFVYVCACVCVSSHDMFWNRVEDNCPFPLKKILFSPIPLQPATERWLFAFFR